MSKIKYNFAFVILCWKRPQGLHTLKYLTKLKFEGDIYFAVDNADPCKNDYIKVANEYKIKYFTFDKDTSVSDQMYNQKLNAGAVCTRKIVENIMREKGIDYFCVLDDDYVNFQNINNKPIAPKTLYYLINKSCEILDKVPFVSVVSLAQGGECVGGKKDFYKKAKFKLKAMNFWFCSIKKPIEYAGIMNDDVNAGILLAKYGHFSVQYGGIFIIQAMQKTGGMKDIYAEQSAMYQKAMFSVMLAPSFVKLQWLMNYAGEKVTKRIYHNIQRKYAYPYIVEY